MDQRFSIADIQARFPHVQAKFVNEAIEGLLRMKRLYRSGDTFIKV
jgi:hypothetical protein